MDLQTCEPITEQNHNDLKMEYWLDGIEKCLLVYAMVLHHKNKYINTISHLSLSLR